jgi:WD40 repeat protein
MVQMFPMVSFHSATQRLAVGTTEGPIGIYDVRTSAKIEIFEGHTGGISSLAFDQKGKWLASYSGNDLTLKLWKVGDSSFFSQLMGGNSKVANQIKLKPLGPDYNPTESLS